MVRKSKIKAKNENKKKQSGNTDIQSMSEDFPTECEESHVIEKAVDTVAETVPSLMGLMYGDLSLHVLWKMMFLCDNLKTSEEKCTCLCLLTDYLSQDYVNHTYVDSSLLIALAALWKNMLVRSHQTDNILGQLRKNLLKSIESFNKYGFEEYFKEVISLMDQRVRGEKLANSCYPSGIPSWARISYHKLQNIFSSASLPRKDTYVDSYYNESHFKNAQRQWSVYGKSHVTLQAKTNMTTDNVLDPDYIPNESSSDDSILSVHTESLGEMSYDFNKENEISDLNEVPECLETTSLTGPLIPIYIGNSRKGLLDATSIPNSHIDQKFPTYKIVQSKEDDVKITLIKDFDKPIPDCSSLQNDTGMKSKIDQSYPQRDELQRKSPRPYINDPHCSSDSVSWINLSDISTSPFTLSSTSDLSNDLTRSSTRSRHTSASSVSVMSISSSSLGEESLDAVLQRKDVSGSCKSSFATNQCSLSACLPKDSKMFSFKKKISDKDIQESLKRKKNEHKQPQQIDVTSVSEATFSKGKDFWKNFEEELGMEKDTEVAVKSVQPFVEKQMNVILNEVKISKQKRKYDGNIYSPAKMRTSDKKCEFLSKENEMAYRTPEVTCSSKYIMSSHTAREILPRSPTSDVENSHTPRSKSNKRKILNGSRDTQDIRSFFKHF